MKGKNGRVVASIVKKVLAGLRTVNGVKAVYIFGSYATGSQLPFSDIDICVFGHLNKREKADALAFGSEKVQVSLFDELPIYIKFQVLKEGKPLFCRDRGFLHDVAFSTLREYHDFHPLLERLEREYPVRV